MLVIDRRNIKPHLDSDALSDVAWASSIPPVVPDRPSDAPAPVSALSDRELRRLRRVDLLEMLVDQERELERTRAELAEAQAQLRQRDIALAECGSIAEASLRLSGVFEAAQAAADQYVENVRRIAGQQAASQQTVNQQAVSQRSANQRISGDDADARVFDRRAAGCVAGTQAYGQHVSGCGPAAYASNKRTSSAEGRPGDDFSSSRPSARHANIARPSTSRASSRRFPEDAR